METSGEAIQRRRLAIGLTVSELAEQAGIHRGTLDRVEADNARPSTVGAVQAALTRLEHTLGLDELAPGVHPVGAPSDRLVEFEVKGRSGVRAVVKGPVRDIDALQDAVDKLIAAAERRAEEADAEGRPDAADS